MCQIRRETVENRETREMGGGRQGKTRGEASTTKFTHINTIVHNILGGNLGHIVLGKRQGKRFQRNKHFDATKKISQGLHQVTKGASKQIGKQGLN